MSVPIIAPNRPLGANRDRGKNAPIAPDRPFVVLGALGAKDLKNAPPRP